MLSMGGYASRTCVIYAQRERNEFSWYKGFFDDDDARAGDLFTAVLYVNMFHDRKRHAKCLED